jgi:flagellar motility protein MotE (MotC chaperone)
MNLRLFDAVIVAAIGLLGLKALGMLGSVEKAAATTTVVREASNPAGNAFARVLSNGRAGHTVRDPEVTGAVGSAKADEKKAEEPKGEQRAEAGGGMKAAAMVGPGPVKGPQAGGKPINLEARASGVSGAERQLLESLAQRREELEAAARDLDVREKLLETAEKKLEARLNELKALEAKVGSGDRKKVEAEEQTAKNLVTMYETMKPKEAARVFDKLGHDVLVPVVLQMNARKMSEVLAAMSPDAAQKLTVALAGRARLNAVSGKEQAEAEALPQGELAAVDQAPAKKQ